VVVLELVRPPNASRRRPFRNGSSGDGLTVFARSSKANDTRNHRPSDRPADRPSGQETRGSRHRLADRLYFGGRGIVAVDGTLYLSRTLTRRERQRRGNPRENERFATATTTPRPSNARARGNPR
jgi:hypothetical protein